MAGMVENDDAGTSTGRVLELGDGFFGGLFRAVVSSSSTARRATPNRAIASPSPVALAPPRPSA